MKKILFALILATFLCSACTQPQRKPNVYEEPTKYQDQNIVEEPDTYREPNENREPGMNQEPNTDPIASSLYRKGKVEKVKITKPNTSCRAGKGTENAVVKKLPQGNVYDVVGKDEDWYIVRTEEGKLGTVNPSEAEPVVEEPKTTKPNTSTPNPSLTADEQAMLDLVNGERSKNGLSPLKADTEVTKVARIKSQDMIDNNYFSHNSPTYGSPFDMLKEFGIKYLSAGENIAGNSSVQKAHTALMNSSGHRKNILNPDFTHIGIGIKDGSKYGKNFTQMFIKK